MPKPNRSIIKAIEVLFLLAAILVSCSRKEKNDPISIPESYLNKQILLRAPTYSNTFKVGDAVNLELKYNSNNEITLPNNYNLRIFENTPDGWSKIEEEPTERSPSGDIILSPTIEMPAVQVVVLFPDLTILGKEYLLRIYVSGNMNTGSEIIEVAAYTDITLYP